MAREKGKIAEREVAALLERWWRLLEPDCRFVRTPQSGGWHGADVRAEFRAAGDIMTTAARFPWCIEVKRREGWAWTPLLAGKASPIWKWWEQTCRDATVVSLLPMLWFRHNREPWTILLVRPPPIVHSRFVTRLRGDLVLVRADALLAVQPALLLPGVLA